MCSCILFLVAGIALAIAIVVATSRCHPLRLPSGRPYPDAIADLHAESERRARVFLSWAELRRRRISLMEQRAGFVRQ